MNRRITTMVFLLLSIALCAQNKVRIDSIKVVYDANYGLSIVEKISDGTYGVVDSKLTTIAPFEYDMIYPYHDKLALAYKDDQCGYLNLQGEIEIPFEYSSGNHFKNGKAVLVKEDKKGVIDTLNNILIPFKYYALATHDHEYYRYQLVKGKFGIMNDSQEIIVEPIYDKMSMKNDSLWVAKRDDKFIVLKNDGTLHNTTQFDKLGRIDSRINGGNFIWFEVDGKRGFLNSQYKTIISPQYERSGIDIGHIVSVYNGKKWGFIDISNNLLTGFIYDKIEYLNKEWSIIVKDGKFNIINKDAKVILDEYCNSIQRINNSDLVFIDNHVYDKNLKKVSNEKVRMTSGRFAGMKHGMMKIYLKNKIGYLDSLGNIAIPGIYNEGDHFYKNNCTAVKLNESWDFISSTGDEITSMEFDSVFHFGSYDKCNYVVVKDGKYGCFIGDKLLLAPQFEELHVDENADLVYRRGNKYGTVNLTNGELGLQLYDNKNLTNKN